VTVVRGATPGAGSGAVPAQPGSLGELFLQLDDPVLVCDGGLVTAANPAAVDAFGPLVGAPVPAELAAVPLEELVRDGGWVDLPLGQPAGVILRLRCWRLPPQRLVVLGRDVSRERALVAGLRGVAELSRGLLGQPPAPAALAQQFADAARQLLAADYSAVFLVQPGSLSEVTEFVYDAPRDRFPDELPRPVGLFAVPLRDRAPVRVAAMGDHPAAGGLPDRHPPIGAFLAVPLLAGDLVLGEIAVANRPDWRSFDAVDESVLSDLATHAATALRWADRAAAAAAEAERRRELTDAARHDIRSPLAAARGYAQLLRGRGQDMPPEQLDRSWDGLFEALERVRGFVDRLLIDDRMGALGVQPEWVRVALDELVEGLLVDHRLSAARRDVRLVMTAEPAAPSHCAADPQMLRSALDNLISNAVKFSPDGGTVQLRVRRSGAHVRFDVHDDGPGIPVAEQDRLFDRYTRVRVAEQRGVPGLGLGLSIVRRVAEAHGGSVGVTSRPGEGTTFWVTFPVAMPASAQSGSR
jgi:signal transduction histidine kinase